MVTAKPKKEKKTDQEFQEPRIRTAQNQKETLVHESSCKSSKQTNAYKKNSKKKILRRRKNSKSQTNHQVSDMEFKQHYKSRPNDEKNSKKKYQTLKKKKSKKIVTKKKNTKKQMKKKHSKI